MWYKSPEVCLHAQQLELPQLNSILLECIPECQPQVDLALQPLRDKTTMTRRSVREDTAA